MNIPHFDQIRFPSVNLQQVNVQHLGLPFAEAVGGLAVLIVLIALTNSSARHHTVEYRKMKDADDTRSELKELIDVEKKRNGG